MLSDSTPNINHVHLKMLLFFVRISIFFLQYKCQQDCTMFGEPQIHQW